MSSYGRTYLARLLLLWTNLLLPLPEPRTPSSCRSLSPTQVSCSSSSLCPNRWFSSSPVENSRRNTNMLLFLLSYVVKILHSHFTLLPFSYYPISFLQKSCLHFLSPFLSSFSRTFISLPVCCLLSLSLSLSPVPSLSIPFLLYFLNPFQSGFHTSPSNPFTYTHTHPITLLWSRSSDLRLQG